MCRIRIRSFVPTSQTFARPRHRHRRAGAVSSRFQLTVQWSCAVFLAHSCPALLPKPPRIAHCASQSQASWSLAIQGLGNNTPFHDPLRRFHARGLTTNLALALPAYDVGVHCLGLTHCPIARLPDVCKAAIPGVKNSHGPCR